jgi:hypothetical protein
MQDTVQKKISKIEFIELYEYAIKSFNNEGYSINQSRFIAHLVKTYNGLYRQLLTELNPVMTAKGIEYDQKRKKLIEKYADRDAKGDMIYQNGQPIIQENIVEFRKEGENLDKMYKTEIETYNNKVKELEPKKMELIDINVKVLYADDVDKKLSPRIVGLLLG